MFAVSSVSIKRGQHLDQWPWPVEVLYKQETVHASLSSDKDRQLLIASVGRQEGMPTTPTTPSRVSRVLCVCVCVHVCMCACVCVCVHAYELI